MTFDTTAVPHSRSIFGKNPAGRVPGATGKRGPEAARLLPNPIAGQMAPEMDSRRGDKETIMNIPSWREIAELSGTREDELLEERKARLRAENKLAEIERRLEQVLSENEDEMNSR